MLAVYPVLKDGHTGLSALGLAALRPHLNPTDLRAFVQLPAPPGPNDRDEDERRLALLEFWVTDGGSKTRPVPPDHAERVAGRRDGRQNPESQSHVSGNRGKISSVPDGST